MKTRHGGLGPFDPNAGEIREVAVEAWDDELKKPTPADDVAQTVQKARARRSARRRATSSTSRSTRCAIIGTFAGIGVAWMHIVNDPLDDAVAYYDAASRLNAGQPLYPAGIDPNTNRIYLYPPLLAIALRPLAILPFEWFALAWELIVVASFVALVRYLGVRRKNVWLAIGILGVPVGWALTVAQAHVPFTYLLAIGQPWSVAIASEPQAHADPDLHLVARAAGLPVVRRVPRVDDPARPGPARCSRRTASFAFFGNVGFEQIGQVRNISPFAQSPLVWIVLVLAGMLGSARALAVALGLAGRGDARDPQPAAPARVHAHGPAGRAPPAEDRRRARPRRAGPDPATAYGRATR